MKHLSRKRSLFWISSICLLLAVSCVRKPVKTQAVGISGTVVSTLFRVEGQVDGQSIHGIRAYLQIDTSKHFMVNLFTALNTPLSAVFYDGKSLTVVNYRDKSVIVDNSAPFEAGSGIPFRLDIEALADFYGHSLKSKGAYTQTFPWGKLLQTPNLRIVGLFNDGSRLLLTPLSEPKTRNATLLSLKIPPTYRHIDGTD
ncbi:MAG: hypothetical protein CO090_01780 [Acidobacteria bacterium CG_4_9_14_3_um_filter_49_7]|nr:MAG: hypothetical protein CO090_01780 [Acidobacteria bacterium CG_4_9_14_3_um_filter_49_7]